MMSARRLDPRSRLAPDGGTHVRVHGLDLLIAATAHAHDARLYTRNAADLVGLDDLLEIVAV